MRNDDTSSTSTLTQPQINGIQVDMVKPPMRYVAPTLQTGQKTEYITPIPWAAGIETYIKPTSVPAIRASKPAMRK